MGYTHTPCGCSLDTVQSFALYTCTIIGHRMQNRPLVQNDFYSQQYHEILNFNTAIVQSRVQEKEVVAAAKPQILLDLSKL